MIAMHVMNSWHLANPFARLLVTGVTPAMVRGKF
jgi:hypothetical protein